MGRESTGAYTHTRDIGDYFADIMIHGDEGYIKQYGRVYRVRREGDVFVVCEQV